MQLAGKLMTLWNPFQSSPVQVQVDDSDTLARRAAEALQRSALAVLRDWAGVAAQPSARPAKRPQEGMVCLAVKVDGQPSFMVAIAASHRLGADLAVAATGDPGAGSFSGEALRELCTQLRERLSLDPQGRAPLMLLPQPLDEGAWPGQAPHAELTLLVNGQPLEIRLWHP